MNPHPERRPTPAENLDRAVSALLDDQPVAVPSALASELRVARRLRWELAPVPPGEPFEEALAQRLTADQGPSTSRARSIWRNHQRLVLTGAVGSVLISTASAALVAWRMSHR